MITSTGGSNPFPTQVSVPLAVNSDGLSEQRHLLPEQPWGDHGQHWYPVRLHLFGFLRWYIHFLSHGHRDLAGWQDRLRRAGHQRYADQDQPDPDDPDEGAEIRVGNVPHSVVISPDGNTAYVSNEAGRIATENDFQEYSNGTPVVAEYPTGATATGTVSVVNLATFTVTDSIIDRSAPDWYGFLGQVPVGRQHL